MSRSLPQPAATRGRLLQQDFSSQSACGLTARGSSTFPTKAAVIFSGSIPMEIVLEHLRQLVATDCGDCSSIPTAISTRQNGTPIRSTSSIQVEIQQSLPPPRPLISADRNSSPLRFFHRLQHVFSSTSRVTASMRLTDKLP